MELSSPKQPLILGHPWLCCHNPAISWRQGELLSWSSTCFTSCLSLPCRATTIEDSASAVPPTIPSEYAQYSNVFSKIKASTPPPHCPEDCAIDLLPGVSPPKGRVYPLPIPENEAMENYMDELNRLSNSSFFSGCVQLLLRWKKVRWSSSMY
ncbi:hypothetical protein J4Q44_G00391440 [Coregonus suidteri]|uniref:Uncharacterized protein n=1 Tax=Coregonus suidteri TaxID=861788 RepID=A0AAN8KPY0_9TELE